MSAAILIFFTFLVSYVLYFYLWVVRKYPKGPTPLPFIGNLLQFPKEDLHIYMDDLSKIYGPCFTLWFPLPMVVLTDYDHIKDAFVTKPEAFLNRLHKIPENLLQPHDGTGVLASSGNNWRTQRRTSLKILRDFGLGRNLMEEQVTRSIHEMLDQLSQLPDKNDADIFWPIQLCVGNVINESLFGFHYSYKKPEKFQEFVLIVDKHLRMVRNPFSALMMSYPWMRHLPIIGELGYGRIKKNIDKYQIFIESEVNAQAKLFDEDSEPENFVHAYMQQMKSNSDLDMTNLYACVLDFWLAGMETTSNSLRWHIAYMMKHPEVQDKVRQEIRDVVGMSRLPAMSDKPNMPYTQAVIHEVQRLSNMIPHLGSHTSTEEIELRGNKIPGGTSVFAQIWSVLNNDPVFENSREFNPSRYLLEDGKTFNKSVMEKSIPFSIGKRACVGEGLARMELFLIFTALIQKYEFVPKSVVDMTPKYGAVLTTKPYKCKLIPQV